MVSLAGACPCSKQSFTETSNHIPAIRTAATVPANAAMVRHPPCPLSRMNQKTPHRCGAFLFTQSLLVSIIR
jgi:hypothetical protein